MVGKYVDLTDSYKSLNEALAHGGIANECRVEVTLRRLREDRAGGHARRASAPPTAILVPMGFGPRGTEGKIAAVRYARENKVPFFGICFGMQMAVIEFARHVCGLERANSTEVDPKTPHPVIHLHDRAARAHAEGRHDAARRLPVRARRGLARAQALRQAARSPSATATATSSTTPTASSSRRAASCCSGAVARRRAGRDDRARATIPWFVATPVPSRVQVAPDRLPSALQGLHPRRARSSSARSAPRGAARSAGLKVVKR